MKLVDNDEKNLGIGGRLLMMEIIIYG